MSTLPRASFALGLALGLGLASATSAAGAAELVTNGDFSAGNTGFTSSFAFRSPPPAGNLDSAGAYAVDTNPNPYNGRFSSIGDHTQDSPRLMFIANGAAGTAWSQTVNVVAGEDYVFSGWLAAIYGEAPPQLSVRVNGVQLDPILPNPPGVWTPFSRTWNSGASTVAILSLYDTQTEGSGNDFVLDDLSFTGVAPGGAGGVPEPAAWSLMLLGFAGMGAMLRRRRPATA